MGSTAAFDKHAKTSNLRANTIDLGYSTLTIDGTVIALIDCPGHASLIRSVLAASSVFDMAIVVIDSSKGIEQQTAEHLLLVSLFCPDHVILVINKIDLVDKKTVEQMTRRCRKVASSLKINSNLQVVPISLMEYKEEGVMALMNALHLALYAPQRVSSGHFMMFIDHCFSIKGKGTVMTGTVVDGICKVGMDVEIAALQEKRKIKSMQRWKEDVCSAGVGDRAALLFHNVSGKDINRTIIYEPGTLHRVQFLLVSVNRVVHFQGILRQGSKLHVSTGFDTVIGQCQFLASALPEEQDHYEVVQELDETVKFAILSLEQFVYTKEGSFFITSRLDYQGKGCRFVFYGTFLKLLNNERQICRFRRKKKVGKVERIENERSIICNSLFKKETNVDTYCKMNVYLSTGEVGRLESAFGKSGKVRISFLEDLPESTMTAYKNGLEIQVVLYFKKFLNDGKIKIDRMLKISLRFTLIRRVATLSFYKSSHSLSSTSNGRSHKLVNINIRAEATNKGKPYVKIISGTAGNPTNNEDANFSKKGYIEIWRKPRRREQTHTTKTLWDMREDIDKLAKTLHRLKTNEKGQPQKSPEVAVSKQKYEEEELRLSTYVDSSVERLSFVVRTPDRRVLIKKFTGITISRTILEMLRDRKVRINEVVTYDFAIVCKPMDTLDIWKGEFEENPAFARVDRFQILHILCSSCYQHFTVHAIALRDILIENWFPWEIPKVENH
ncbi:hypothetical protein LOAG_00130 [Loa loa]|uniref:Tr-type G domain-containing protein n=1 Tax=Loa loa TaxID=7209 RepID=A0A1I7VE08_LOALO|nr:hypothetical protein LOAG_00130 [Loa loa]EFO28353.1 hypothetical protein LOAG_00130 [Loa loa]